MMITNNKKKLFGLIALSVLWITASCSGNDFFNEYQSVQNGWDKEDVKLFDFESLDTISEYKSYINIRTNNEYPFSNLFLIVKMFPPEGDAVVDTLQYQMANPDGTMLGSGFTDVKEHKLVWRNQLKLKKQGIYKIEIEHAMRKVRELKGEAVLNGITEIGLQIQ